VPVVQQVLETILTLNAAGFKGGADQATRDIDRLQGRIDSFGRQGAIAGAIAAAGFVLLGKAALEAGEDTARFNRAAGAFGGAFPRAEMEAFTDQLQRIVGIENDVIAGTVGVLGTFGATANEARQLTAGILNTAEAMKDSGVTANALAEQIGKALESGQAGRLGKELGIDGDAFKGASRAERMVLIMDALARKGKDAAAVYRNTLPGAIQAFHTEIATAFGNVGKALDGPGAKMLNWTIAVIQKFNDAGPVVHGATAAIGVGLAGAAAVYAAAMAVAAFQTGRAIQKIAQLMAVQSAAVPVAGRFAAAQAGAGAGLGMGGTIALGAAGAVTAVGAGASKAALGGKILGAIPQGNGFMGGAMAGLGGAVGGLLPGAEAAFAVEKAKTEADKQREATEKNTAALEKNTEATKQAGGGAVSTSDVPLYRQLAARQVRVFGA